MPKPRRTPLEKACDDVHEWNVREVHLIGNNRPLNPRRQVTGGERARRKYELMKRAKTRELANMLKRAWRGR